MQVNDAVSKAALAFQQGNAVNNNQLPAGNNQDNNGAAGNGISQDSVKLSSNGQQLSLSATGQGHTPPSSSADASALAKKISSAFQNNPNAALNAYSNLNQQNLTNLLV